MQIALISQVKKRQDCTQNSYLYQIFTSSDSVLLCGLSIEAFPLVLHSFLAPIDLLLRYFCVKYTIELLIWFSVNNIIPTLIIQCGVLQFVMKTTTKGVVKQTNTETHKYWKKKQVLGQNTHVFNTCTTYVAHMWHI